MRISDWSSDVCSSDLDALIDLYVQHGYYKEKLISLTKKGKAGAEEIKAMMDRLRSNPHQTLGGIDVAEIKDYAASESYNLKKIGRASGRERVCQYVYISVVAVSLKKK